LKAAVLTNLNSDLEIMELEVPELTRGQILVKIKAAGICGAQINQKKGIKINPKFLPCLMGHEGSGIVEKIGKGVTKVKEGDKVVLHWRPSKGLESDFPKYKSKREVIGSGLVTTFSEYSVVSENRLTKVTSKLDFPQLSLFGCAITTGMGIVDNEINLKKNESIAVFGVGGVGLNVIIASKLKNAYPIIAIDRSSAKLKKSKELGATHFINTTDVKNLEEELKNIIPSFPKYNVETTGNINLIAKSYECLSSGGTAVLVGQPNNNEKLILENFVSNYIGKTLLDTSGGKINPDKDIQKYLDLLMSSNINLENLIYEYYSLEDINKAFKLIEEGNDFYGRVVIVFE